MLTVSLFGLLLWGNSHMAAADAACEGRFVNPITDICWRCMFPLSLGSTKVTGGDLPDTSNPGSPIQFCPMPPPVFPARWPGNRVLGADGHDRCGTFSGLHGEPRRIHR